MSEKAVPSAFNPAITGKDVLITGGGGSIGSELARQVHRLNPRSLTLLDINENNLYLLSQSLSRKHGAPVTPQVISFGTGRQSSGCLNGCTPRLSFTLRRTNMFR